MNRRSFRPRFALLRVRQILFERKYPGSPWLTADSIRIMDSWLKPTDVAIEWGSGRSTTWIAARVGKLLSIEENPSWHEKVSVQIKEKGLAGKVDYRLIPCTGGEFAEPESHAYSSAAEELADNSVDFALVDGSLRVACMRMAMRKLKPGGLVALDNANRFVPNFSLGRTSTYHEPRTEPKSPNWTALLEELASWRYILTTDGVWNTLFWVKPPV